MADRWSITDEFGNVRLGDFDLPGVFSSMEISQDVEIEEKEVKGRSGKAKQIIGYSDAIINFSIVLTSDSEATSYDKLKNLQKIFGKTDSSAKPEVMRIINVHCESRGIEKVIFKSLRTSESSGDTIEAFLEFVEYLPVIAVKKESRASRPVRQKPNSPPPPSNDENKAKPKGPAEDKPAPKPKGVTEQFGGRG